MVASSNLPTKGKPLVLRTLADQSFNKGTALIYGPSGAGKTWLIRSFAPFLKKTPEGNPDWSRVLLVIADPGQASIKDLSNIQTCTLWEDMKPNELLSALSDPSNKGKFDLIYIDGLDSIAQRIHQQIDDSENAKPKPDGFTVWREFGRAMRTWVTGMRDIPGASVIFISHDQEREDGDLKYRPKWPGGETREELCGYFDYVFYMRMAPLTDPAVKGKEWPALFITNRSLAKGGDPRCEVKCRVAKDKPEVPGKVHADLHTVFKALFPQEEK